MDDDPELDITEDLMVFWTVPKRRFVCRICELELVDIGNGQNTCPDCFITIEKM